MKFLAKIPLVMSLAEWVWPETSDGTSVTARGCVEDFPLMSGGCWNGLVAKALGIAIIGGACLNKTPMIFNIWTSQSTRGLSAGGLYGEVLVMANSAAYGMLMNYPFTAYGETIGLLTQSIFMVFLQWTFADPAVSVWEKAIALLLSICYAVGIFFFLPTEYYYILMASQWPLLVYAKGAQIVESFRVKHTGAQAIITIVLNLVGSTLRVYTTLEEVGWDMALLTGSLLSVFLNGVMMMQYLVYRKNTQDFLRSLQKEKTA